MQTVRELWNLMVWYTPQMRLRIGAREVDIVGVISSTAEFELVGSEAEDVDGLFTFSVSVQLACETGSSGSRKQES